MERELRNMSDLNDYIFIMFQMMAAVLSSIREIQSVVCLISVSPFVSTQRHVHRRPSERGLRSDPQREEEGQRGGPHGAGGRRQGPRRHPGGRHGRHLRHHLPRRRQVSDI